MVRRIHEQNKCTSKNTQCTKNYNLENSKVPNKSAYENIYEKQNGKKYSNRNAQTSNNLPINQNTDIQYRYISSNNGKTEKTDNSTEIKKLQVNSGEKYIADIYPKNFDEKTKDNKNPFFLLQMIESKGKGGGDENEIIHIEYNNQPNFHKNSSLSNRLNTINIPMPPVSCKNSYTIVSDEEYVSQTSANDALYMPPECIISEIENKKRAEYAHKENFFVKFEYGTFSFDSILAFKRMHMDKKVKNDVLQEQKWFKMVKRRLFRKIKCQKNIHMQNIEKFQYILENNSCESSVKIHDIMTPVSSLASVCCDRWLDGDIFEEFVSIIEKTSDECVLFNFTHFLRNAETLVAEKVKNKPGLKRLIFYIHVGLVPNNNKASFVGSYIDISDGTNPPNFYQANHFTLGIFDIEGKNVYYADSKAWPVPKEFLQKMKYIADELDLENISYQTSHLASVNHSLHGCSNLCSKYYPYQTCSNICGIIAIIFSVMAAIDFNGFKSISMSSEKSPSMFDKEYLSKVSYLKNASRFSCMLRLTVIEWLVSGKIDMKNLYTDNQINVDSTSAKTNIQKSCEIHTNLQTSSHEQNNMEVDSEMKGSKLMDKNSPSCKVTEPSSQFPNSSHQLNVQPESENKGSKMMDKDRPSCEIKQPSSQIPQKPKSVCTFDLTNIEKLIIGKPKFEHLKKLGKLRIKCINLNHKIKTKQFSCSHEGISDKSA